MFSTAIFLTILQTSLYPNNLNSLEFDQEAPQIFCPERMTIAKRQGTSALLQKLLQQSTSEDNHFEAKPTQSKANVSSCLGIIAIGGESVRVEIADTPEARQKGLMGRKQLLPNTGMLFIFDQPQPLSFWMKNTFIPLSIAFFDEKKQLIETMDMPVLERSTDRHPLFISSRPALYALEVPQKWFQEKGIEKGMEFSFIDQPDELE